MALNLAVDSNRYVNFCHGIGEAVEPIRSANKLVMLFIALAELRGGFQLGNQTVKNESVLARFLRSFRVNVLFADEGTTHFYSAIFAELSRAGTPIPTNDIWIAALVQQHDLVLFSRDKHFDRVPRIARI